MTPTMVQLIHRDEVVTLLQRLVRIPSINPFGDRQLTGPEFSEAAMGQAVADYFAGTPCEVRFSEALPHRHNVIVTLPGRTDERLLFETHMDTVPPSTDQIDPFDPIIKDNAVWGRGSCDAKASLAAMMVALKRVASMPDRPRATIVLAAVIDEEYGFAGVRHLVAEGLDARAAIVGEPTMLDIVIAHKGVLRFKVETLGKSAHSSVAERGVNAVMAMNRVLTMIQDELIPVYQSIEHPLLGHPTINVGTIGGGLQANIVPDRCIIDIDRRLLPGEDAQTIISDFQTRLHRLKDEDATFEVVLHPPYLIDNPLETSPDQPIVSCAQSVCQNAIGRAQTIGVPYGTDASKIADAGIPTIVLGPGTIDDAHTATEHIDIDQLLKAAKVYAGLMLSFTP